MLVGDSQTMTSEAAVIGTPSIRSNSFVGRISYLEEEEHKYGLTFGFLPDQAEKMFDKISELLAIQNLKSIWRCKRSEMLKDKIDVSSFFVWFVENWPESNTIMKSNPDYQYNFR
jgi:predicted glycosyltransferase